MPDTPPKPNGDSPLDAMRDALDHVDDQLVGLINERARIAQRIGQAKAARGLRVYAPDRERQVLDRVAELSDGPVNERSLRAIYRELMSASLALERTPRIAVLGPQGSYSHLAGRRKFGTSVEFELVTTIAAVFDELEHGHAESGLVPVENSIAGGVGETLDLLVDRSLEVCGELNLAVHHHLFGSGPLERIERVYSKPEAFDQCRKWLADTGLSSKTVHEASTSAAAERAAREPNTGAIASDLAGELFGLSRIAAFVEDDAENVTRFLILGGASPQPTGSDKTAVVFSVGHQSGALADTLDRFRDAGLNLTRIESRPDRRCRWAYCFFVDFLGHAATPEIANALEGIANACNFWKIIGSFPASPDVV